MPDPRLGRVAPLGATQRSWVPLASHIWPSSHSDHRWPSPGREDAHLLTKGGGQRWGVAVVTGARSSLDNCGGFPATVAKGTPGVQSRGSSRKVQMLVWSLSPSPSVGSDHATILITCLCPERTARHRVCSLPLLRYEKEWWLGAWRRRRRVRDLADARSTALRPAPVGARCGAGQPAEPSHPPVREGGGSQRPVARHGTARWSRSFPPGSPRRGRRPNG